MRSGGTGIHAGQPVGSLGPSLAEATGVLILAHGRGSNADDMLGLARALVESDVACLAPQAAGHVWYPNRFMEPLASNEAELHSALSVLADLVGRAVVAGVPHSRIVLAGFSQGACLALEAVARGPYPVGGALGFSGGLIGETVGPYAASRRLAGMPVFLSCSERDPHIPAERVRASATALAELGAVVDLRLYPGNSHTVTAAVVASARSLLAGLLGAA